jgi:hypothetical protein
VTPCCAGGSGGIWEDGGSGREQRWQWREIAEAAVVVGESRGGGGRRRGGRRRERAEEEAAASTSREEAATVWTVKARVPYLPAAQFLLLFFFFFGLVLLNYISFFPFFTYY